MGKVVGADTVDGINRQTAVPTGPIPHYLIQVGANPDQSADDEVAKYWLQVPATMDKVYGRVFTEYWSFIGGSLVRIHGRLCLEGLNGHGNIELQEFLADYPSQVETVCYFQFRSTPQ